MRSGLSMQRDLLECQIVSETRMTEAGPGEWFYIRLGEKLIPLGTDEDYANSLAFATKRNAESFEGRERCYKINDRLRTALYQIADMPATTDVACAVQIAVAAVSIIPDAALSESKP